MDDDHIKAELLRELEQDQAITDDLLNYATADELSEFHNLVLGPCSCATCRLLRRMWRRAMAHEYDAQLDERLMEAREEEAQRRVDAWRYRLYSGTEG